MLLHHALLSGVSASAITAHLGEDPGPGPGLPWVTVAEWVPTGSSSGWDGYTTRLVIEPSALGDQVGTHVRLTFTARSASSLEIDKAFIQQAPLDGSAYDFRDLPLPVLFEGAPGFNIAAGESIVSDPIELAYDAETPLVVSFHTPPGSVGDYYSQISGLTGWTLYYKNADDAETVDAASYTQRTYILVVTKIEFVLAGTAGGTNIRIPPWRLPSSLTGFPVAVNLADLSDSFWDGTTETGGNIRVTNAADVPLPFDLVFFDKGTKQGRLFFRADLSNAANNDFKVITEPGATALDPTDTYGRNAVWQDFEAMFAFESLTDRTGNGHDAVLSGASSAYNYGVGAVSPSVNAHQGVAYDGTFFYVINTSEIKKYNSSWALQATNSTPLADTGTPDVNHLGDGCIKDGELFVVYERYPNNPYDNQHVAVFDPADLSFKRTYDISAQGHEVSSICWDATNGYFVISDFTSPGYTKLHKYDTNFNYLGEITIPSTSKIQGIEYYDGHFWLSTDSKTLYKLTLDGATRTVEWSGSISGYMEGLAADGTGNFFILFDGSPSAIYTFVESATVGEPGWLNLAGGGQAKTNIVPAFTSWVIGASYIPRAATQGAIVSYSADATANTTRSTMVQRDGDSLGIWNSADGWLDPAGTDMVLLQEYRGHMLHDATTRRRIYHNGLLRGTDETVSQRPGAGTNPILFIGAEDASLAERASGSINYVYLRDGLLTDDWIAVEGVSWMYPNMLYDVLDQADANAGEAVAFSNPAATVDAAGWTARFGAAPGRTTSRYRSSPAAFHMGNGALNWWDAEITVPAGQESYIDAGAAMVEVPFWQQGYVSDLDEAGALLEFRDASDVLLARRFWPREDIPGDIGNWQPRKASCPLPVGTRKVRFGFNAKRYTGTELSQYADDIGPMEFKPLPGFLSELIFWKDGSSAAGAVNVSGTLAVYNHAVWAATDNVLYWGSSPGHSYFPIDVSARATEIDEGGCRIDAYTFQSGYDASNDPGRAYIEFRDGSDDLIGTQHGFSESAFIAPVEGVGLFLDLAVPEGTRTIRFGMESTNAGGGADSDGYQQWLNVFFKTPRS